MNIHIVSPPVKKQRESALTLGLWINLGTFFLFASLSALFLRYAMGFIPLLSTAVFGCFLTWRLKRGGFFFSLTILAIVALCDPYMRQDPLWYALLSTSIALSWLLLHLGHLEAASFLSEREERVKLQEKQWIKECAEMRSQIEDLKHQLTAKEQEKSASVVSIAESVEESVSPKKDPAECDYLQLRAQFEEKSYHLDKARQELFLVENQLLSLQRELGENLLGITDEDAALVSHLSAAEREREELTSLVCDLEEIISVLSAQKKRAPVKRRTSKKAEEEEPTLF